MENVVLLHGWGMSSSVFDTLAAQLAHEYAVRALDLPGYDETLTCEPYTLDNVAAAVAARAPETCFVVGWSLGAQIALWWAHAAPAQVRRLALLGATPCFVQRNNWKAAVEKKVLDSFADALRRDRRGTLERFVSLQAHGDAESKRVIREMRAALAARRVPPADVLERGLELLSRNDLRALARTIEHDTLVIQGERDQLTPLLAAQALTRALPSARLAVVEGAAHAPFVSNPARVSALISEFFRDR